MNESERESYWELAMLLGQVLTLLSFGATFPLRLGESCELCSRLSPSPLSPTQYFVLSYYINHVTARNKTMSKRKGHHTWSDLP